MDASSSSSVLPSTSDPPDPSSISKTYHVKEISDRGTFIMSGDIQGPAPLIYFCNVLLLQHRLQFESRETEIQEDALYEKLMEIALDGFMFPKPLIKKTLIDLSSEYELIPLFSGATIFKDMDASENRGIKAFRVRFFHGLTFDPEDKQLKDHIGVRKYDYLICSLEKKEKRSAERNTELSTGWRLFKNLVDLGNPYSISSIRESIRDFGVFYRKGLFSTITEHDEELYVLHPGASHFANDVVWQKLTALTDMENGLASGFFNGRFESFDLPGFVELPMVVDKTKRARAENEGFIGITERHKNFDPLKADTVQATRNNVKKNSRLAKNFAGKLLGQQFPSVFSEYLKLYRIIVEASASVTIAEDALKDLRSLKGAILELLETYLNNAESPEEHEENYIAPLMDIVLGDYFANAPDIMPCEFRYLSATVIKKCRNIPRTFKVAFDYPHKTITNNLEYHDYCFSLLVQTLSYNFEDLNELPCEAVLTCISCAFERTDTNPESVLELLAIFENNIRNGKLAGSLLNEYAPFLFCNILKAYRAATAEKVHSLELIGGIFKFVEASLDKAEDLDTFEELYVVPLMDDILKDCVVNAPNNTVEFQSLLRTIVNKCTKTDKMFMSILNCQIQEMTSKDPKCCHRLIILFYAASKHGCQFLTCLPDKERNFLMDSISSTVKHNDMNIVETGLLLLEKILSAFQAPKFECFYKVHFFTIEKDVLEVLMISCHGSNLEHLALELLQNLFTLVDKLSQPLWDSETTPVHYNPVFVMEHTTKFFVSACKEMASKEVRKLVDKVFDAKHDTTLFKQNTRELISALKQPPESVLDLNTVPSLNEKECSSSGLYAARASFIKTFKEQFKAFLEDFIESGDHSAHYKGVVYGMYGTGSTDMKISLEHIKIYRSGLARDLTRSFDSVQYAIIEAASEYALGIIQELDSKLRISQSVPPVHPLLRGASARVSIVDMPRRMITFLEFIASPGNEIVTRQTIFGGPNSIAIENQTDVGTRAIFGYLDHLTSVHVQGYSWDGKFTQENFMVSDDEKFEICKSKCGSCSQQNKMNDYTQFQKEFLTLYGEASFIPVLALPMKHPLEKFPSTDAERLRVEYVTHPGGRPPVIRTAFLLDLYRAWKFLRSQGKKHLKSVFDIICDWRKKVKANSFLKKVYDYVKVDATLLAILRDLPEIAIEKLSPGFGLIEGEHSHGDDIYDDTLLLFIIFVRHAIIHVADPEKWDYKTWIRKLTEIDALLTHVLAREIEQIISEFTVKCYLLSEEVVTMLEESWNTYATYGMTHAYGKQFTLRQLKSFSAAQAKKSQTQQ